jgi:hypothetical protein
MKSNKNRLWNNALKNVALHEIYSKKLVTKYFASLMVGNVTKHFIDGL